MTASEKFKEKITKGKTQTNEVQTQGKQEAQQFKGPRQQVRDLLDKMAPEIQLALPKHMNADRMARVAMTAVSSNPKLLECEPKTLLGALMEASQLGLEPNTGLDQAYLIPYYNKNIKAFSVQLQISYKGMIELARRSGQYKAIYAHEVYEEDTFEIEYGLHKNLIHKPVLEPESEPIGYYAVYHLTNGGFDFIYWTREKVEAHGRKYAKSFDKGPWRTNFDQMAKKTVLKDLLAYAPKSIEIQNAVTSDDKTRELSEDGVIIDVTDYTEEKQEQANQKALEDISNG